MIPKGTKGSNPFPSSMEKYSSGRRDTPAKGAGRETGARVRISPSPPCNNLLFNNEVVKKKISPTSPERFFLSYFCRVTFKLLSATARALNLFFSTGANSARVNPFGSSNISSKPNPLLPLGVFAIKPFNIPS